MLEHVDRARLAVRDRAAAVRRGLIFAGRAWAATQPPARACPSCRVARVIER